MNNLSLPTLPALPGIFKSRRFWLTFATFIVDMFLFFNQDMELQIDRMYAIEVVTTLGMMLVGAIGFEDLIRMWKAGVEKDKYL